MKKLSVILLSLIIIFTLVACGDNGAQEPAADSSTNSNGADIEVTISIDYPDDSKVTDVKDAKVVIAENSSVLDVLNKYAKDNKIEITMADSSSMSTYVSGINGVESTDTEGWLYQLNSESIMDAADQCSVNDGDSIEWEFSSWAE